MTKSLRSNYKRIGKEDCPLSADYLSFSFLHDADDELPFTAFLSLKKSEDMKFNTENGNPHRKKLVEKQKLNNEKLCGIHLEHSHIIHTLESVPTEILQGDGLLSTNQDLILSVTVADCMPIWLYDKKSKCFGVLHSGWKGTGISVKAIEEIVHRFKTKPENMSFILGPCISASNYPVHKERYEEFKALFGNEAAIERDAEYFLDLRKANINLLLEKGVGHILDIDICTSETVEMGSCRREGMADFTRMLAYIAKV